MSVYKHPKSPYWHYDFKVEGTRFHGSTGCTSLRAAQACERRKRNEQAELGPAAVQQQQVTPAAEMTVNVGVRRWWEDKGERLDTAHDRRRQLLIWIALLGKDTQFRTIREANIAGAIRKRRAMLHNGRPPSDATLNRFIAALRAVWRHLDSDESPLPRIKWGKWTTEETVEHPPEITDAHLDRLDVALNERADMPGNLATWASLMGEIAYTYGLRAGELYFPLDAFKPEAHAVYITKKRRKRAVTLEIALLPQHTAAIAARWARAMEAGLPHIWFDDIGGTLVPVSRGRGDYQLRRALTAAGLGTRIHDLRHRVGTQLLRKTNGNLKLVQEQLGHASIQSTIRYTRISADDRRAAIAGISRNCPEPDFGEAENPLPQKGKAGRD